MKSIMNFATVITFLIFLLSSAMIRAESDEDEGHHGGMTGGHGGMGGGGGGDVTVRPCTRSNPCTECEHRDCDNDNQCAGDLLCADDHKELLTAVGLDSRKAYCPRGRLGLGGKYWELCYDPKRVPTKCEQGEPCTKCEARDCDRDEDCAGTLLCADEHEIELTDAGFDPRKANCDENIGLWNWELCFDPAILTK